MNDHEVRVDDTVVPVKLTFAETFNVARHFTRRHIGQGWVTRRWRAGATTSSASPRWPKTLTA